MAQAKTHPSRKRPAAPKRKVRPDKHRLSRQTPRPAPPPSSDSQTAKQLIATRLAAALRDAQVSQSQLARQLAGEGAPPARVESIRRLILKWLSAGNAPSLDYALRLADILGKDDDYFTNVQLDETSQDAVVFIRQAALELQEPGDPPLSGSLASDEIAELFPHFNSEHILIDDVTALIPGKSVQAVTRAEWRKWPYGSFYKTADMIPGFVLAEALAQTAAIALLAQPENRRRVVLCAAFNAMRFRHIVPSNKDVVFDAEITHASGPIVHADVKATVDGEVAVRGRLTLAVH